MGRGILDSPFTLISQEGKSQLGMYTTEEIFAELRLLRVGDFRTRGPHMPPELVGKIKALSDVFASATSEERRAMTCLVQPSFSFIFLWFAKEMAIQPIRQNSQQTIIDGVTALLIEDCKFDRRDSTVPLALLYQSAEKLGLNTNLLFTGAVQMASVVGTEFVLEFLRRPSATKSIEAFGYAEGEDSGGFMYVPSS
jgi:hypothetical protein